MERRNFIKAGCNACMVLGSGILVSSLASCSPKLSITKAAQKDMKFSIPESEMTATDIKLVTIKNFDYDVFIKKNSDRSYFALAMICTHAGHSLVKKGPAEKNLVHLPIINNDGILEITLVAATSI
jgi:Rieske [2Fe-2S] domain